DPRAEVRSIIVQRSTMGVYAADDWESMICHYDFHREPGNEYPLAHLQVVGETEHLTALTERVGIAPRSLDRFHFPVGGKRYRPALEELIEFLVREQIARCHPQWETVVADQREHWERIQLRAVVQRDPETAADELGRMGYAIKPPPEGL